MRFTSFTTVSTFVAAALVASCGDDVAQPKPPRIIEVTMRVSAEGGHVHTQSTDGLQYDLEIPPGALSGTADVTLSGTSAHPSNVAYKRIDNLPLSISVSGAGVIDTLVLALPKWTGNERWRIAYLGVGGRWRPLDELYPLYSVKVKILPEHLMSPLDKAISTDTAVYSSASVVQIVDDEIATRVHRLDGIPATPLPGVSRTPVLLVHGICAGSDAFDMELKKGLYAAIGDVWALEYDWRSPFNVVAANAAAQLDRELGGREIFVVAHSKGGLVARAIVRQPRRGGVSISRVVFLGTPHLGVSESSLTAGVFLSCNRPIQLTTPGYWELRFGSEELGTLTQPLLLDFPEYLCVVGNSTCDWVDSGCDSLFGNPCGDAAVCERSANLAASRYDEHESAAFRPTVFVDWKHDELVGFHDDTWDAIRAFFSNPPYPSAEHIGLYAEAGGINCYLSNWNPSGANYVYVVHQFNRGSTACEFRVRNASGAPYSTRILGSPSFLSIGDPETGTAVAYGLCIGGDVIVMRLRYADDDGLGLAPTPCGMLEVVAYPAAIPPSLQSIDCNGFAKPVTGGRFYWGQDCGSCGESALSVSTTWGGIEALYRQP